jgi:hypothetical protein
MLRGEYKYRTGLAHFEAKRLVSAENCFRAVVAANPSFALGHFHLGLVLRLRGQWQGALHAFQSAVKLAPNLARAHVGLGAVLVRLGRVDEAEAGLRQALALDPGLKEGHLFLGDLLRGSGRLSEARVVYEALLARFPDDADGRFGRGFLNLLEGDLAAGWRDYEFRAARRGPVEPALTPQWRGEDPANKILLLYGEQGIGDTIQFLRYVPVLAKMGAKVLVAVPVTLQELASRVDGVHEIVPPTYALPRFDYCAPLPSLPFYCRTALANIPWPGAYLSPPPAGKAFAIPPADGERLTVALGWAGNPDHPNDHNRSLTVAQIKPLLKQEGIRWLVLQSGSGAIKLDRRPDIVHLGSRLTNFSDIAAVLCRADLVISVDTSFCHLAGALGRPVWTLLSYAPDWRWMLGRSDTPWYPSMRLFRQSSLGDWTGVIDAVSQALAAQTCEAGRH